MLLGKAYLEKGDWSDAASTFKEHMPDFEGPILDSAFMGHGYASEGLKKLDEALDDYKRAEDSRSGFEGVALLDMARIHAARGNIDDALKAYNRYLDMKPRSSLLDFIRFQILKLS